MIRVTKGIFATAILSLSALASADMPVEHWQMLETELDFVFVSERAPLVERQEIFIDPINVWYPTETGGGDELVEQLQHKSMDSLVQSLNQAGYVVLESPKPGALRLHVELIDLKLHSVPKSGNPWQDRFVFDVTPGHLTLVMELIDIDTNEVLMRAADQEKSLDTNLSPWQQAEDQLLKWSQLIAGNLTPITEGDLFRMAKK
ncbi:MAG: hypothetical protein AAF438_11940 [Pseudomonadota bacterium]